MFTEARPAHPALARFLRRRAAPVRRDGAAPNTKQAELDRRGRKPAVIAVRSGGFSFLILEGYRVDVVLRFIALGPPNTADCPLWCDIVADYRILPSEIVSRRFYATARYIVNAAMAAPDLVPVVQRSRSATQDPTFTMLRRFGKVGTSQPATTSRGRPRWSHHWRPVSGT